MKRLFLCLFSLFIIFPFFTARTPVFAEQQRVRLPVVMYHNVLNGRQGEYVVSERQLESDLIAIKKAGYTFVSAKQVIDFVDGKGSLPPKPLLLTFDDGNYNNMYYAFPLLKKHGACAVFNVIGAFVSASSNSSQADNPNYSHLTWKEISTLHKSGKIEIGNHTYGMHVYKPRFGVGQMEGESETQYRAAVKEDAGRLQTELSRRSGVTPVVFAYPFGKYTTPAKEELLSLGFRMLFTCNEGVTTVVRGDSTTLHYVRRFNRNGKMSTKTLLEEIESGKHIPVDS